MNNKNNQAFVDGTSALKPQLATEWGTIIEFPDTALRQERRNAKHQRAIEYLGEENYRNLMGAEIVVSRAKVIAGTAFMFLGAVATVFVEALI